MSHFKFSIFSDAMTKAISWLSILLGLATLALPSSCLLAQSSQGTPTVKITSYLPDDEASCDRLPLPVGGFVALQQAIKYPDIARRVGLEGRVVVKATIDSLGKARDVKLLSSDAAPLGDALIAGLNSYRFKAGLQRGRAISVQVMVIAVFSLHDLPDPCASDSSNIIELVLEHYNENEYKSNRTIILNADGSAEYEGPLGTEPIDTSGILSYTIPVPDYQVFHGVAYHGVGGFNPLDFHRLCVLLNRLVATKSSHLYQRVPSIVAHEVITLVTLDGKRKSFTSFGEEPELWSIARTIDCIASQIQWYQK